ncbi:MAG: RDD family protein [Roseibacillus sp.]
MEFWVVREGEKEGPMLDFDLRSRIREGEVTAEQKIWYSDLEEWTPIGEVELFVNEFVVTTVTEENVEGYLSKLDEEERAMAKPPPIPTELHIWRRFGARWFDYLAYMAVFFTLVSVMNLDLIGLQQKALFPFVLVLPWIFLEAASLHFWGTTPGKWLSGLKVRGPDQQRLSAGASMLRTMRVMILGMGFAQPILREICQALAFWFATKKKVVLWDTPVGTRLERIKDVPQKWVAFGVGMAIFLMIIMAAAYQIGLSQMSPEDLKEMEEKIERILMPQAK